MSMHTQKEVHLAHVYNREAWNEIPTIIRTCERLGYDVELKFNKDGMNHHHNVQIFVDKPEKGT